MVCSLILSSFKLIIIHVVSSTLILPPMDKMKMGMTDMLEEECEDESDGFHFAFEVDVTKGYQLATRTFASIVERKDEGVDGSKIWFPAFKNHGGEIERLAEVLNNNSDKLGGLIVTTAHWPEVPASLLDISWTSNSPLLEDNGCYHMETKEDVELAIEATKCYVGDFLVKKGLCPFTKSIERAAINLDSVGVKEGPVVVRHVTDVLSSTCVTTPAAAMAYLYWDGVSEMIERDETDVATHLLVCPSVYDNDFSSFARVCNDLIEPTVSFSSGKVGRVWFHPEYSLQAVENDSLARGGHAPPLEEVDELFGVYMSENPAVIKPDPEDVAWAHDKSRWTPHATINLLRSSQLKAASDNKMRSRIFPKNILSLLRGKLNSVLTREEDLTLHSQ